MTALDRAAALWSQASLLADGRAVAGDPDRIGDLAVAGYHVTGPAVPTNARMVPLCDDTGIRDLDAPGSGFVTNAINGRTIQLSTTTFDPDPAA